MSAGGAQGNQHLIENVALLDKAGGFQFAAMPVIDRPKEETREADCNVSRTAGAWLNLSIGRGHKRNFAVV